MSLRIFAHVAIALFLHGNLRAEKPNTKENKFHSTAEVVSYYGYQDCIRLANDRVVVVLCPRVGGRVLEYSLEGNNMLFLPAENNERSAVEQKELDSSAGRFDIGPELVVDRGKELWLGEWKGEIINDHAARLTSQHDPKSGARLVRDFELDPASTRLRCTQTIKNESDHPISLCHWSRTFAIGGGIAVVPRTPRGRFPNGYVMYQDQTTIIGAPHDPDVTVSDQAVLVTGPPKYPKLGFDSHSGWLGYLAPINQLFIKRFQTVSHRAYNELAALTVSVWYPEKNRVELEPIGPAADLAPGRQSAFTEDWFLLPHEYPKDGTKVDFDRIAAKVKLEFKESDKRIDKKKKPPKFSPEVHADHSVTFRLDAATAANVTVAIGNAKHPMDHYADGTWEVTIPPQSPGVHDYTFLVDGVRTTDPRNRWVKKWLVCTSLFEIPGDSSPPLTQAQDVPTGIVHRHHYHSSTTNSQRAAVVYTPPGYDLGRSAPYPVLVLCHGFGDDETAWTEVGRAHHILDNMIAAGTIEPIVVVMPHGHPLVLDTPNWSEEYGANNNKLMADDIVNDVLPLLKANYHVTEDAKHRAIAGLSMGGGHSITTGMKHPGLFDYLGAFSAAAPEGDLHEKHPELLPESDRAKQTRKLFWIACGVDDFLLKRNRKFVAQLKRENIEHNYVETDGAHSWEVWRDYLPKFLVQCFAKD